MSNYEENDALYSYTPMKANEIRLLRLHFDEDRRIHSDLRIFPLEPQRHPEFVTLSYVWGKIEPGPTIQVGGKTLPILASLYDFFQHLCNEEERWRHAWWWIDAVCINNEDIEERGNQVRNMGTILQTFRGDSSVARRRIK